MLMMIGGCLMMLEPLLRRREPFVASSTQPLREAFASAEMHIPREMRDLLQRIH